MSVDPNPTSADRTCGNCAFWDRAEVINGRALCRRSPPQFGWKLGENGIDYVDGSWPMSWTFDWCGEFTEYCEDVG